MKYFTTSYTTLKHKKPNPPTPDSAGPGPGGLVCVQAQQLGVVGQPRQLGGGSEVGGQPAAQRGVVHPRAQRGVGRGCRVAGAAVGCPAVACRAWQGCK